MTSMTCGASRELKAPRKIPPLHELGHCPGQCVSWVQSLNVNQAVHIRGGHTHKSSSARYSGFESGSLWGPLVLKTRRTGAGVQGTVSFKTIKVYPTSSLGGR